MKSEVSLFLARAFTKTQPAAVNKKLLKALTAALTKNINESGKFSLFNNPDKESEY